MQIDAVELTLFAWEDIPPTKYSQGSQNTSGKSALGLLRIGTDAGIDGYAFLGSSTSTAETDAGALVRYLKPQLIGRDPLARESLHAAMRARRTACSTTRWTTTSISAARSRCRRRSTTRSPRQRCPASTRRCANT